MTPKQCRAARAMLRWRTSDLAKAAAVTERTVNRFENNQDAYQSTITKLENAILATGHIRFEGNCVCFIEDDILI